MPAASDVLSDILPAESARAGKWWRRDEERFVGIPTSVRSRAILGVSFSRTSSKDGTVVTRPLAASFSSAAVKQEQRIRFDCLRRVASPQLALRRFDRRPHALRRVVG